MVGVIILYINQPFSLSNQNFVGMSMVIFGAGLYSFSLVLFKKELITYSRTETIFYQNIAGALLFTPFLFINKPFPAPWQIAWASFSGVLVGIVGFMLFFTVLRKVQASSITLATITNVLTVAAGVIILKETLTFNMIIGGILILAASLLIRGHLSK